MPDPAAGNVVHIWRTRVARPPRGVPRSHDPIVRAILGPIVAASPDALKFERGPRGKPRLVHVSGRPDLRFNVSHSGEWLVVAVAVGGEVGVDVQEVGSRGRSIDGIARFCTPAETSLLDSHSLTERPEVLARLWAAKEAVLKATGEGVDRSLRELDVSAAVQGGNTVIKRPPYGEARPRAWTLMPVETGAGYAGAVAVEGEDSPSVVVSDWPAAGG